MRFNKFTIHTCGFIMLSSVKIWKDRRQPPNFVRNHSCHFPKTPQRNEPFGLIAVTLSHGKGTSDIQQVQNKFVANPKMLIRQ